MAGHPVVPFDQALIDDVASAMDLRAPNREALEKLAKRFDDAGGEPFEAVCAMATAVGKTYLAGALIEYLARSGIRNFMIVVPRTPVLDKTVNNFTRAHPKSVTGGMECDPVLFTVDNFITGAMGAALSDDSRVKVGVFTVQSLLRPKGNKVTRRVTKHQEWLGEDLYGYLQGRDDLVVIADESHTYREKAKAFSAAVRELDAMATVGLTATPDRSEEANIVYRYPLGRAIADEWVKKPVIVGRKDDASDIETRLRDGLLLLDAKQRLADDYAAATGKPRVNAVMFVIADRTDTIRRWIADGLLPRVPHTERVLIPTVALEALAPAGEADGPAGSTVTASSPQVTPLNRADRTGPTSTASPGASGDAA